MSNTPHDVDRFKFPENEVQNENYIPSYVLQNFYLIHH